MQHLGFLALSLVCTFFTCFQSIAICSWLQPFFLLQFFHRSQHLAPWKSFTVALLCHSIVNVFACLALFPVVSGVPRSLGLTIEFLWAIAVWVVLLVPFLFSLAYRKRFANATLSQPIVFASLWTTAWYVWNKYGQMGSLLSPAITQFSVQPLVMTASLWGLEGITFIMAWFSAILHDRTLLHEDNPKLKTKKSMRMHKLHAKVFLVILVASLFYGNARVVLFSGSFYQRDIAETMSSTVPVSCLVSKDLEYEDFQVMLNRTAERLEAGDRIVLWSETAVVVTGSGAREALISAASKMAKQHNAYIGITYVYEQLSSNSSSFITSFNTFDFVLSDGSVGFSYAKSHLVPFMETLDTTPGELKLPVVDTEFGRVGGAICFDFEFPDFMQQSSLKKVDIMLQPAETWGPTGPFLYRSEMFRAVENGFTWFRCSTGGVSGIFNTYQQTIDYREANSNKVLAMELPIDKRARTLYAGFGFILPIVLILVSLLHLVVLWLPIQTLKTISGKAPDCFVLYFTGDIDFEVSSPLL